MRSERAVPAAVERACGAAAAGEWAMELREGSNGPQGIPAHPCSSHIFMHIFTLLVLLGWEDVGSLWVCGLRRPSFYELAEMGLNVACQHQRGDQLLWL